MWQRSAIPFNLERAVGRPSGCVPRGVWQGATRRNSGSIPTSCNTAKRRAGRALEVVAGFTRRVSSIPKKNPRQINTLDASRSGQLPFPGSTQSAPALSFAVRRVTFPVVSGSIEVSVLRPLSCEAALPGHAISAAIALPTTAGTDRPTSRRKRENKREVGLPRPRDYSGARYKSERIVDFSSDRRSCCDPNVNSSV